MIGNGIRLPIACGPYYFQSLRHYQYSSQAVQEGATGAEVVSVTAMFEIKGICQTTGNCGASRMHAPGGVVGSDTAQLLCGQGWSKILSLGFQLLFVVLTHLHAQVTLVAKFLDLVHLGFEKIYVVFFIFEQPYQQIPRTVIAL